MVSSISNTNNLCEGHLKSSKVDQDILMEYD